MSKPILWLGPLEDLDVDFDPLLGISARPAQPNAVFKAAPAAFDPSRSVFDDPVDDAVLASAVPTVSAIANDIGSFEPEPAISQVESNAEAGRQPVTEESALEATKADAPEAMAEGNVEPLPLPEFIKSDLQATDFTHNNDPIPHSQDSAGNALDQPSPAAPFQTDTFLEAAPPKKSFFASLFSVQAPQQVSANNATSINDIWAKTQADPLEDHEVPSPSETKTLEVDSALAKTTPDFEALAAPNPAIQVVDGPQSKTNIWANIDDDVTVQTDVDVIPAIDETALEPIAVPDLDVPAPIENADPVQAQIAQAIPEAEVIAKHEELGVEPQEEAPVHSGDSDPEVSTSEVSAPELATSDYFQKTFNADKFWSLPRGTNPPHPEPPEPMEVEEPISALSSEPDIQDDMARGEALEDATLAFEGSSEPTPITQSISTAGASPTDAAPPRPKLAGRRRKKKVKKNYIGTFVGTCLFMIALVMTVASSLAVAGYPFTMLSSYRWYWVILGVLAAATWGVTRGWKMVGASFAVIGVNLFVTVPATGKAPTGGNMATAVVGWANVAGNPEALARVFKDAEKKKATLLMLAETPQNVFSPPAGWTLIEAPIAGDPTAIAVLSRSTWRAVTVPGEPTMARPQAGDLTIIGLHPPAARKGFRKTIGRDSLINRSGTRAGIQEGPTVVLGDFDAPPWAQEMKQFRSYGNVTRVACGGWAATTLSQGFGLIGIASDHAFVRDVMVTHCQLGRPLTGGNHKPIWLYVKPQPAPPAIEPQP